VEAAPFDPADRVAARKLVIGRGSFDPEVIVKDFAALGSPMTTKNRWKQ